MGKIQKETGKEGSGSAARHKARDNPHVLIWKHILRVPHSMASVELRMRLVIEI